VWLMIVALWLTSLDTVCAGFASFDEGGFGVFGCLGEGCMTGEMKVSIHGLETRGGERITSATNHCRCGG